MYVFTARRDPKEQLALKHQWEQKQGQDVVTGVSILTLNLESSDNSEEPKSAVSSVHTVEKLTFTTTKVALTSLWTFLSRQVCRSVFT